MCQFEPDYEGFGSYREQEWVGQWDRTHSCTLAGVSSDACYLFVSLLLAWCQTSPDFAFLLSDPSAEIGLAKEETLSIFSSPLLLTL